MRFRTRTDVKNRQSCIRWFNLPHNMVFSRQYATHPALQSFVRYYHIIHIQLDPRTPREQLPQKPYPPGTEQCLYFYPYDLTHSVKVGNQTPERVTSGIIVGQPLTRMNITINPNYLMLKVSFQPGSLFRLLGIPMNLSMALLIWKRLRVKK